MYIVGAFVPIFWTNVICSVFPLIYGAILILMPESPVYYMIKGRDDDAIKSIKWLRGKNYDTTFEIDNLKSELRLDETAPKISQIRAFRESAAIWSIVVVMGMMIVQQLSGVSVVLFFTTRIFIVSEYKRTWNKTN